MSLVMVYPTNSTASSTDAEAPVSMFVQVADNIKVDAAAQTFRLVSVGQQTLFFSDRPERIAGHLKMPAHSTNGRRAWVLSTSMASRAGRLINGPPTFFAIRPRSIHG